MVRQFDGRLLAADESPEVLEGRWDREKLVMMSFPDESAYQEIARDRKSGADTVALLVKGFSRPE